jgi:hypothetical protein
MTLAEELPRFSAELIRQHLTSRCSVTPATKWPTASA